MIIAEITGSLRAGLSRKFERSRASNQMGCNFDSVSARQIASFFDPRYKDLLFELEAARDAIARARNTFFESYKGISPLKSNIKVIKCVLQFFCVRINFFFIITLTVVLTSRTIIIY